MKTRIDDENVSGTSLLCDFVCVSHGSLAYTYYCKIFWVNLVEFRVAGRNGFVRQCDDDKNITYETQEAEELYRERGHINGKTPSPTIILLQKKCVAREYIDKETVLVESILTRGIHEQSDNSAESIRRSTAG